ncbi:MAG: methyltransferase domain-containing protein [Candidatus Eremiobacteraeota bacterium]|nr:methyltransferase domain-containing protein [Candidatus Eremiobacteraeota bacterium]
MSRRSGQRFDAEHGVTTEALLFLGELDPQAIGDALRDATHYEPVPVSEFDALIDSAQVHYESFTFVDAGAGMGRAVLLASKRQFKQVVGVEVSPALAAIARENIAGWVHTYEESVRCRDIRIVCADATRYRYPRGNLLIFLYNPFGASSIRALGRALRGHEGVVVLCYHTAVHSEALCEECPDLRPVDRRPFGSIFVMGKS